MKELKRVGLVTHYGNNYGALLQAYALQKKINDLGYSCSIMKYEYLSREHILHYYFRKYLTLLRYNFTYLKKRRIIKNNFNNLTARDKYFQAFRNKYLKIDNNNCTSIEDYYRTPPEYDCYVCGSDQIWNPTFYSRCNPIYFLDFVPAGKKGLLMLQV